MVPKDPGLDGEDLPIVPVKLELGLLVVPTEAAVARLDSVPLLLLSAVGLIPVRVTPK